jgi:hypothetical protein
LQPCPSCPGTCADPPSERLSRGHTRAAPYCQCCCICPLDPCSTGSHQGATTAQRSHSRRCACSSASGRPARRTCTHMQHFEYRCAAARGDCRRPALLLTGAGCSQVAQGGQRGWDAIDRVLLHQFFHHILHDILTDMRVKSLPVAPPLAQHESWVGRSVSLKTSGGQSASAWDKPGGARTIGGVSPIPCSKYDGNDVLEARVRAVGGHARTARS